MASAVATPAAEASAHDAESPATLVRLAAEAVAEFVKERTRAKKRKRREQKQREQDEAAQLAAQGYDAKRARTETQEEPMELAVPDDGEEESNDQVEVDPAVELARNGVRIVSGADLKHRVHPYCDELLMRTVLEKQPFAAPSGQKEAKWSEVAMTVNNELAGFMPAWLKNGRAVIDRMTFLTRVWEDKEHDQHAMLTPELKAMVQKRVELRDASPRSVSTEESESSTSERVTDGNTRPVWSSRSRIEPERDELLMQILLERRAIIVPAMLKSKWTVELWDDVAARFTQSCERWQNGTTVDRTSIQRRVTWLSRVFSDGGSSNHKLLTGELLRLLGAYVATSNDELATKLSQIVEPPSGRGRRAKREIETLDDVILRETLLAMSDSQSDSNRVHDLWNQVASTVNVHVGTIVLPTGGSCMSRINDLVDVFNRPEHPKFKALTVKSRGYLRRLKTYQHLLSNDQNGRPNSDDDAVNRNAEEVPQQEEVSKPHPDAHVLLMKKVMERLPRSYKDWDVVFDLWAKDVAEAKLELPHVKTRRGLIVHIRSLVKASKNPQHPLYNLMTTELRQLLTEFDGLREERGNDIQEERSDKQSPRSLRSASQSERDGEESPNSDSDHPEVRPSRRSPRLLSGASASSSRSATSGGGIAMDAWSVVPETDEIVLRWVVVKRPHMERRDKMRAWNAAFFETQREMTERKLDHSYLTTPQSLVKRTVFLMNIYRYRKPGEYDKLTSAMLKMLAMITEWMDSDGAQGHTLEGDGDEDNADEDGKGEQADDASLGGTGRVFVASDEILLQLVHKRQPSAQAGKVHAWENILRTWKNKVSKAQIPHFEPSGVRGIVARVAFLGRVFRNPEHREHHKLTPKMREALNDYVNRKDKDKENDSHGEVVETTSSGPKETCVANVNDEMERSSNTQDGASTDSPLPTSVSTDDSTKQLLAALQNQLVEAQSSAERERVSMMSDLMDLRRELSELRQSTAMTLQKERERVDKVRGEWLARIASLEREREVHNATVQSLIQTIQSERSEQRKDTNAMLEVIQREREDRREEFVAMMNLVTRAILRQEQQASQNSIMP